MLSSRTSTQRALCFQAVRNRNAHDLPKLIRLGNLTDYEFSSALRSAHRVCIARYQRCLKHTWAYRRPTERWFDTDHSSNQTDQANGRPTIYVTHRTSAPDQGNNSQQRPFDHLHETSKRFDALKRQLDEDPFGVIFGRRAERLNPWGPWELKSLSNLWSWSSLTAGRAPVRPDPTYRREHIKTYVRPPISPEDPSYSGVSAKPFSSPGKSDCPEDGPNDTTISCVEEYDFDPITMRKIPRKIQSQRDEAVEVPVRICSKGTPESRVADVSSATSQGPEKAAKRPKKATHRTTGGGSDQQPHQGGSKTARTITKAKPSTDQGWLGREGFLLRETSPPGSSKGRGAPKQSTSISPGSMAHKEAPSKDLKFDNPESDPLAKYSIRFSGLMDDVTDENDGFTKSTKTSTDDTVGTKEVRRRQLEADFSRCVASKASAEEVAAQEHVRHVRKHLDRSFAKSDLNEGPQASSRHISPDKTCRPTVEAIQQNQENEYAVGLQSQANAENNFRIFGEEHSTQPPTASTALPRGLQTSLQWNIANAARSQAQENTDASNPGSEPHQTSIRTPLTPDKADLLASASRPANDDAMTQYQTGTSSRSRRDPDLVHELQTIYEDAYGKVDVKHRQPRADSESRAEKETHELMKQYEKSLGPVPHAFTSDSADSETQERPKDSATSEESARTSSDSTSPDRARFLEEKEQILHEEVIEGARLLDELSCELDSFTAASKKCVSTPNGSSITPQAYKILAYDPTTESVNTANITSSVGSEEPPLSPAAVIPCLTHAFRFLPSLRTLEAEGYEIVSGRDNVLVFRKARNANLSESAGYREGMNPIDGTMRVEQTATGNFASPTGFVNYDAVFPLSMFGEEGHIRSIERGNGARIVRREEDVFSGSRSSWNTDERDWTARPESSGNGREKPKGGARRMARRALVMGTWVAGCTYVVGIVAEFVKVGA